MKEADKIRQAWAELLLARANAPTVDMAAGTSAGGPQPLNNEPDETISGRSRNQRLEDVLGPFQKYFQHLVITESLEPKSGKGWAILKKERVDERLIEKIDISFALTIDVHMIPSRKELMIGNLKVFLMFCWLTMVRNKGGM
ncbi:hypothetical protein Tco_1541927 [Tanacetum coccineum]